MIAVVVTMLFVLVDLGAKQVSLISLSGVNYNTFKIGWGPSSCIGDVLFAPMLHVEAGNTTVPSKHPIFLDLHNLDGFRWLMTSG